MPDSVLRIGIQQKKKKKKKKPHKQLLKVSALIELDSNWGKQPMSKYKGDSQLK